MHITQINLQRSKKGGGAEVYTNFLINAFNDIGVTTRLIIDKNATFWNSFDLPDSTIIVKSSESHLTADLTNTDKWILIHTYLPLNIVKNIKKDRLITSMAHMPVQTQGIKGFTHVDMAFPVSKWVQQGLREHLIPCWNEPLYGVANIKKPSFQQLIYKNSLYDWDLRKVRDRVLGWIEPAILPLLSQKIFTKKQGITIGIVSRITTIKQFPELFDNIVPVLLNYPSVNIEIFGSGGYASVRDLKKAVLPIKNRVRFWGYQNDIASVYKNIDYLLTGLPEKEALGLNIIEAQSSNVPVIAIDAMPFTETVINNVTGLLYTDPRMDNGEGFETLIKKILNMRTQLHPAEHTEHTNIFSYNNFILRVKKIYNWAKPIIECEF